MKTQCEICQSIHKQAPDHDNQRACMKPLRYPEQYPPNARNPQATIVVDCAQFSHINGGVITIKTKRR